MRRLLPLSISCFLCLTMPPTIACAQVETKPYSAGFSVEGSNNYRISVDGWPDSVRVLITEGRAEVGNVVETEYTAPATTSKSEIQADLGSFGTLSMRFEPSGRRLTKNAPKGCEPHKIVRRQGTFVGTFRFVGEDGYTTVETSEAKGSIGTPDDLLCARFIQAPRNKYRGLPQLSAATEDAWGFAKQEEGQAFGTAIVRGHHSHVVAVAESLEKLGTISIRRFVDIPAPRSSFSVTPHLRKATVSPPPPFTGTGIFERGPKGSPPSWSGSLAVSFPGQPALPLTGHRFTSVALVLSRFP